MNAENLKNDEFVKVIKKELQELGEHLTVIEKRISELDTHLEIMISEESRKQLRRENIAQAHVPDFIKDAVRLGLQEFFAGREDLQH